jgi:hypothetical protein
MPDWGQRPSVLPIGSLADGYLPLKEATLPGKAERVFQLQ